MKKKSSPVSMIVMMAVIGMLVSVFSGDFEIGATLADLGVSSVEELLNYLNIGLAFLALAGVFIFLIARAARGEEEYYWEFEEEDQEK